MGHLPKTQTQLYSDSQVLANNLSNISYSWPIHFVGNGESLKTVVNKYCKSGTSQKYILNGIADSPFVYDGTTIVSGVLTLDYSSGYWNGHPMYTFIDGSNTIYIGTLNISNWKTDVIEPGAKKSDYKCGEATINANTGTTNVTFPQAFNDPPVVVAVARGISKTVMHSVKVDNISKSGFAITAVMLAANGSIESPSFDVSVEWIAMRKV